MLRISQLKLPVTHTEEDLKKKIVHTLMCRTEAVQSYEIIKQSLDARKKPDLFYVYTVDVKADNEKQLLKMLTRKKRAGNVQFHEAMPYVFPAGGNEKLKSRPVVVGCGPAGLFCAYFLAEYGYQPVLLEQGAPVEERQKDVEEFWKTGVLKPDSNVQFGEGGAGTFSDGKLNTLIKDPVGRNRKVLEIFVENGAPKDILYVNKPHIGTDILRTVIRNMREKILVWGGEIHFHTQMTEVLFTENTRRIRGIVYEDLLKKEKEEILKGLKSILEDIENKKILEQKEHLNDGLLEFQENYFQTIQFKVKKMMKNKLGYLYDNYFMDVYHHDEITNRHQIQLEALIQIMIMVVLLFSIFIYKKQQMTLGTVMLVYLLLSYMIDPLMKISAFIAMHDELQIIFERYKEMLPEKRERKKKIKKIKSIELKHVSFSYGYTRPLFDHFLLKIEKSVFIQGKTGSGKSTLLKLIMNQLQPTKGEIVINGINLQELDLNSYYSHIKYLNKTPVFYKESLRTNIIFDRLFLENKMIELLHYFMLDDLVNGLDLKLDEQGGFLSSGQGQLVMIIRALLSEPDVLILDEAFSNIDQERLQLLINYLSFQKIIVIIVSHQINMMNCQFDCVIIDSGKIVGEEDYGNRFST